MRSPLEDTSPAAVVAVDARSEDERRRAETMVPGPRRIREDRETRDDLLGWRGKRPPVIVLIANLAAPGDKGVRDIVRRIGRAFKTARRTRTRPYRHVGARAMTGSLQPARDARPHRAWVLEDAAHLVPDIP